MNFAIIGKGFIYPRHVEAIAKNNGKILMTCDIDKAKDPDFLDYKEMFRDKKFKEEVDAVVICTPNHLHKQMIKDALATNKKVLCEKPLIIDDDFTGLDGVNVVFQLRYHDLIPDIKYALTGDDRIEMTMKVYRDQDWWDSWKGDESKSGGIMLGIAIHMFDFLIYLLGDYYFIVDSSKTKNKCTGIIHFPTAIVNYCVEVLDSREGQTRSFLINGQNFELCDKDNLSFAGYHDRVHREFQKGEGIPLSEAKKAIELILGL